MDNFKVEKDKWEQCPNCLNCGVIAHERRYTVSVTREMAMDAGDPSMEGIQWDWGTEVEYEQCEFCWTNPKSVFYQENELWKKEKDMK